MNKVVFFDRDGVLNKKAAEHEYITKRSEFERNDKAKEMIKLFSDKGFLILVITNQQGIGKGKYSFDDLDNIHSNMQQDLKKIGTKIDKFYVCPHLKEDNCNCRKPKTGMLEQALKEYGFNKKDCILIGDSDKDIECAKQFGIKYIKIESDKIKNYSYDITNALDSL
ncbi:MAG: HAD family hydrolase [Candidatus Absconditabacterales bacterium]